MVGHQDNDCHDFKFEDLFFILLETYICYYWNNFLPVEMGLSLTNQHMKKSTLSLLDQEWLGKQYWINVTQHPQVEHILVLNRIRVSGVQHPKLFRSSRVGLVTTLFHKGYFTQLSLLAFLHRSFFNGNGWKQLLPEWHTHWYIVLLKHWWRIILIWPLLYTELLEQIV